MEELAMAHIAELIVEALAHRDDDAALARTKARVLDLTAAFPLYREGE